MKIKVEHLEHIKKEIAAVLDKYGKQTLIAQYETGKFSRSEKVKDLQKRFCFDLAYAAGLNDFTCKTLYSYLDDTHLYTAYKSVCPKVVKRY